MPRRSSGSLAWSDAHFGYRIGSQRADLSQDRRNNASGMPKCQVIDPAFSWGDDRNPRTPWHDTIIYEMHVRGFTKLHPQVPPQLRGTYAGLGTTPVIEYLQDLGVTAVELMPVHWFLNDRHLVEKGLRNYWGYNSIGYFAPHQDYSSTLQADREFKTMVKALHSAGIEVILDVVYNHTAEGNHLGPTLSFRGIDNAAYYRLVHDDPRYYMDYTGCGNTLNMLHPRVLQMIMDSLRYWITEMHVDGFRFDLAAALARELHEVDRLGAFFDIIHQDPVISQVKLIAEPWDLGEGGYQVGTLPGRLDGMERQVSRRDPRLLERRGRPDRRSRLSRRRLERPVRARRPTPVCERQLRHRARRLHAARPRELQRQAQRGEQGREPRRRESQPQLELRRRRPDRRPGDPRTAAAPDAQPARVAAAVAGRADAAGRR